MCVFEKKRGRGWEREGEPTYKNMRHACIGGG